MAEVDMTPALTGSRQCSSSAYAAREDELASPTATEEEYPLPDYDALLPSPSQKAYWEDPFGFLTRLKERAMTLFESNYFAYPTDEPHCFSVVHHARRAGAKDSEYFVRPVEGSCTCPFFTRQETGEYLTEQGEVPYIVPCKHLQGLSLLMRKTRRWLYATGQIRAFCALVAPWMRTLAYLRRERIREERAHSTDRAYDGSVACAVTIYQGVRSKRNSSPQPHTTTGSRREIQTGKEQSTWKQ